MQFDHKEPFLLAAILCLHFTTFFGFVQQLSLRYPPPRYNNLWQMEGALMNTKLPENSLILLEGGSLRGLYTTGALGYLDGA